MASRSHAGGHLDATAGREVVYCHACSNEWHRDEYGLSCPACEGDITEIVDPDSDPRELDPFQTAPPPAASRQLRFDYDSDPEEADIEEYTGPHGFVHRRSVRNGSDHAEHHDPGVEPVLNRFYEMVQGFGGRNTNAREHPDHDEGDDAPPWPRIHRATFTSGPFGGGTASVTIFSGPLPDGHGLGHAPQGAAASPFQAIFSNVLRDLGPPQGEHQGATPPNFARGLQEILSMLNGAHATAGDAVYSQEALDHVITQLMEVNPQSNAAPPASEEALKKLDRKPVDQDMLKGESKTECTICIDEMHIGDIAATIPCKHWFHEKCVILWLKEHNTCPICRAPLESDNGDSQSSNSGSDNGAPDTGAPRVVPVHGGSSVPGFGAEATGPFRSFRGGYNRSLGGAFGRLEREQESTDVSGGNAAPSFARPRPARLDEAFRVISTVPEGRDRQRGRGTPWLQSYDTSRMQRRSSFSPTSPPETAPREYGARMRQRSPSQSSRREQSDGGSGRQASQGPISWLRERFTGSNGSSQGSSRDERR